MKQNNALDFDDLLFATTKLLADETIRRRWQDHFHYILAFGSLGLSGLFANKKDKLIPAYLIAITGRFIFAVFSG